MFNTTAYGKAVVNILNILTVRPGPNGPGAHMGPGPKWAVARQLKFKSYGSTKCGS